MGGGGAVMERQGQQSRRAQSPAISWCQRNGARVPAAECLPPAARVSVRRFVALMESMMEGEGEPAEA